MAMQAVFQRYEIKYLIQSQQYHQILQAMVEHMEPDAYPQCHIRNIYYDTPDHRLIRTSLEKPVYKEKLRLRSYGPVSQEDTVFLELKKKYHSTVYKRRIALPFHQAKKVMAQGLPLPQSSQIAQEIDYCGASTPIWRLPCTSPTAGMPGGNEGAGNFGSPSTMSCWPGKRH